MIHKTMRRLTLCLPILLTLALGGVGEELLTAELRKAILEEHNAVRRRIPATDMKLLEWNDDLASTSLRLTEGCTWSRTPKERLRGVVRGFDQLSQNLLVAGVLPVSNIEAAVQEWAEEGNNYRYETGQCSKVCWRYTQVVWANSHAVGCSLRACPSIENVRWGKHGGFMLSCLYGPGGNEEGRRPYIRGETPCTNCSNAFPYCVYGLCSRRHLPTTPTTTPSTEKPIPTTTKAIETTVSVGSATSILPLRVGYLLTLCLVLNVASLT